MTVTNSSARFLTASAAVIFGGIILSGPVAVGLVAIFAPQPAWEGAETFVRNYSWLQTLPYVFGFMILGGFTAFMSGLVGTGREDQRPLEFTALGLTIIAATLVFFNYVLQTAFVPQSLDGNRDILAMVTMNNPRSLGWGLEMYGYGLLGVATIVAAPLFEGSAGRRKIRILFILNGVVSIVAAMFVPLFPGWLLTPVGMIAGAIWNLLIIVLMVIVIREFKGERTS